MKKSDFEQIDLLFNPQSVAVVGATDTLGKWGFDLIRVLLKNKGSRKIYPVNTMEAEVSGVKAYRKVSDIPEPVDFVAIVVPESQVISVMKDCVKKGVKGAIVITAGFAEVGEKGLQVQKELVQIARQGNIRFIGPNTMGHFNMASGFNTLTYSPAFKTRSGIGLISQSGNIGGYVLMRGLDEGIGFSKFIGTGNEADVTLEDLLEYLGQDEETRIIAMYIEGLRQGRRFFDLAREITRKKPIVAIKVGRTEAGTRAVRSHTSALSGSDAIYDAMFKQCGVIRVDKISELFDTAVALLNQPVMRGNRIGILTRGGGFGALASDACQKNGLELSTLSNATLERLNEILPPYWSHANPVDMVASNAYAYSCVEALMDDDNVDAVYYVAVVDENRRFNMQRLDDVPPAERENARKMIEEYERLNIESVDKMVSNIKKYRKPIIFCASTPSRKLYDSEFYHRLLDNNSLVYATPEDGARVLSCLAQYSSYRSSQN